MCHAPAATVIYPLSLHDALPISILAATLPYVDIFLPSAEEILLMLRRSTFDQLVASSEHSRPLNSITRSEEHTSELQSRGHLVCRLLLEKKKSHTKDSSQHPRIS